MDKNGYKASIYTTLSYVLKELCIVVDYTCKSQMQSAAVSTETTIETTFSLRGSIERLKDRAESTHVWAKL